MESLVNERLPNLYRIFCGSGGWVGDLDLSMCLVGWAIMMHWLGLDNGSGPIYLFWSGFFGDVTIFAALIGLYFHHNCHSRGCLRWGKHKVDGSPYCKKHK